VESRVRLDFLTDALEALKLRRDGGVQIITKVGWEGCPAEIEGKSKKDRE
jgi:hypothetical protein